LDHIGGPRKRLGDQARFLDGVILQSGWPANGRAIPRTRWRPIGYEDNPIVGTQYLSMPGQIDAGVLQGLRFD
jgi:hypothetical protein